MEPPAEIKQKDLVKEVGILTFGTLFGKDKGAALNGNGAYSILWAHLPELEMKT
jgi:hypothetical protein